MTMRLPQDAAADELGNLQATMAAVLVAPTPLPLDAGIVPGGTLTSESALDVYRRGYVVRLTEQLAETYEAVWWMLGDARFFEVCAAFIQDTPSISYNLSDYGEGFADFVATLPEAAELEVLPELARLEWRFKSLFHLAEHAHVEPAALAALGDLSAVRLVIGQAVDLVSSPFAVGTIFARRKEPPDGEALHWREPQRLLLYKLGGDIFLKDLDAGAYAVLYELRARGGVEEALAAGLAADDAFGAAEAGAVFELLARCGLVTEIAAAR